MLSTPVNTAAIIVPKAVIAATIIAAQAFLFLTNSIKPFTYLRVSSSSFLFESFSLRVYFISFNNKAYSS